MNQSWIVLIPPLLVLFLSIITKQVLFSLIIGIISGGFIVAQWDLWNASILLFNRFYEQIIDITNIYTFGFLIVLGMLITLISMVGGASAYGDFIKKILKSKRATNFSSISLSFLFMIDDFFSSITVGCIMKPLTDRFQIPRIKLAFLIDSLAAPLVILMPVSTWVAMLLMQLNKSGISLDLADKPLILADPFLAYLRVIPYTFYSFAILFSVLMIVYLGLSFGLMKRHEEVAVKTGNLFGGKPPLKQSQQETTVQKGKIIDFIMPLGSLLLFIFLAILYTGDTQLLGGNNPLLKTIQQADIFLCLLLGSTIAFIINYLQMVIRKLIAWHNITTIFSGGWDLMYGSILTLFLAWTFSELMKNDLQTGQYLARLLIGSVPAFSLPIMFFITALITAIATGSSWGTIAIMIPLAVPMTVSFFKIATPADPQSIPILFQIIGAVFSGAVAGDHLSPIASTSIMSATSAGAYLEDHIYSQFPYAIPALLGTSVAYIITGSLLVYNDLLSWSIAFCSALLVSLISLLIMNKKS